MSYAMFWWIGDGPRRAGRVDVDAGEVVLASTTTAEQALHVAFDDVDRVTLDRGTLTVRRRRAPALRIGSLDGVGALRELADRLADATRDIVG